MTRIPQPSGEKGSLRAIQTLVNDCPDLFWERLRQARPDIERGRWVSPCRDDQWAEYRDETFLKRLGVAERIKCPLREFWPRGGPQWDALGIAGNGDVLLVEAKANIPELVSHMNARAASSIAKIGHSLDEVRAHLGCQPRIDWTSGYYQYVNRVAHLYYLMVKNGIGAWLVNVYFIGDRSVDGPRTADEWHDAIRNMKADLGLDKHHELEYRMIDLFIRIEELDIKE
jgi:hypothetical protein